MGKIYLSPPDVGERERQALLDAFDSGWIAPQGPALEAFEEAIGRYVELPGAVGVSSGTAGLHLALCTLGVGLGDEVLLPSLSFIATANVIRYCGATPLFLDSEEETWNLDPAILSQVLQHRAKKGTLPKAVIAVDIYGQCAQYEAIEAICRTYDIALIEDAAEAIGSRYKNRPAGSFGNFGVFSFNGNKLLTCGGGGAVITQSKEESDRIRYLATQAKQANSFCYIHEDIGFNYRLNNLLAALMVAQLKTIEEKLEQRKHIAQNYRKGFADIPGIGFQPVGEGSEPNNWLTVLTIDSSIYPILLEDICVTFAKNNIETRFGWNPLHKQPPYQDAEFVSSEEHFSSSVCESLFSQSLCLPSGSSLSSADQERIIDIFREILSPYA